MYMNYGHFLPDWSPETKGHGFAANWISKVYPGFRLFGVTLFQRIRSSVSTLYCRAIE